MAPPVVELKSVEYSAPLEEIVRQYSPMVMAICLRVTRNKHDAEDAVQAVFLCLAEQMRQGRPIRAISPWLHQVATRASIDLCRRRKRRTRHENLASERAAGQMKSADPAAELDLAELRPLVRQTLDELSAQYRLPLILHYYGGLSNDELARELRLDPGTLRVRLHRGHKQLRERLMRRGILLAGGVLGAVLGELVRCQVSEELLRATVNLGHHAAQYGIAACPVASDVMATCSASVHSYSRIRITFALAIAAAGGLAAGQPLLAKLLSQMPAIPTMDQLVPQMRPMLTAPIPSFSDAGGNLRSFEPLVGAADDSIAAPWHAQPTDVAARSRMAVAPMPQMAEPRWALQNQPAGRTASAQIRPLVAPVASSFPPPANQYAAAGRSVSHIAGTGNTAASQTPASPAAKLAAPTPTEYVVATRTIPPAGQTAWIKVPPPIYFDNAGNPAFTTGLDSDAYAAGWKFISTASDSPYTKSPSPVIIYKNSLINNGQIIAQGPGEVVDYSTYASIRNTIENPTIHGYNGWFAKDGGKIILPPIHIATGTHRYNWGEDPSDNSIDLVNAVTLLIKDAPRDADLKLSLIATDSAYLPTFPAGHHLISTWSMESSTPITNGIDLTMRYDDGRIQTNGLDERAVKLWYFDTTWHRVMDATLDPSTRQISGHIPPAAYFAVSTPEPTGTLVVIVTGGALLLRRKRKPKDNAP